MHQIFRTLSSDIAIFFFRKPALSWFSRKSGRKPRPLKWQRILVNHNETREGIDLNKENVIIQVKATDMIAREKDAHFLKETEIDRLRNVARGESPPAWSASGFRGMRRNRRRCELLDARSRLKTNAGRPPIQREIGTRLCREHGKKQNPLIRPKVSAIERSFDGASAGFL